MSGTQEGATAGAGSRAALAVLVALVVFSPWPFGSVDLRTTQAITIISLATALGAFLHDGRREPLQTPRALLWPLLGLWALAVFQLIPLPEGLHRLIAPGTASVWHPDAPAAAASLGDALRPISLHPEATRRSLAFGTGLLALAMVAVPALRERRLLLRAAVAIVTGGVLVAVYGLVARLVFTDKLYGVWSVPTITPFGPFVSKNHFAGYVELTALLSLGLAAGLASEARHGPGALSWIESRRARWVVAAWGAAAILVIAVPVCLSRGGVVSLCAGLVAFAGLRLWSRRDARLSPRRLLALGVAAGLLLVALVFVLPNEARARVLTLAGVTTDQSGSYRLAVWRDTLRLVGSSPWLGSGFGAYEDAIPRFKTAAGNLSVEHAESDHLELLAEGGLVAATLVVALVTFVLTRGLRGATGPSQRLARGLVTGAMAGLIAIGVHSTFDFNLRIPSNALVCAMLVAVVLSVTTDETAVPVPRTAALAVTLTLGAALLTPWAASRMSAGPLLRAARSGESSLRRARLDVDVTSHLRRRPADAAAWLALAWLRFPSSRDEASSLASWAVRLDPTNRAVRDARSRLSAQQ